MKQILLISAVFAAAYYGFKMTHQDKPSQETGQIAESAQSVVSAPTSVASLLEEAPPTPLTKEKATPRPTSSLQDPLGKLWNESEWGGEWRGVWTRRGRSPFFDAVLRRGNQTKTFFAAVTLRGRAVHIVTQNSTDGRNCIYDGIVAQDGLSVAGTYGFGDGSVHQWSATIEPAEPVSFVTAPAGVFFLLQSRSMTTNEGVSGLIAGTQLTLVEDRGETLFVKAGRHQFELLRTEVTNDVSVAQYLVDTERSMQQFIQQRGQAEVKALAEARRAQAELLARQQVRDVAEMSGRARFFASSGASNPLARGAYNQTVKSSSGGFAPSAETRERLEDWRKEKKMEELEAQQKALDQGQKSIIRSLEELAR